MKALLPLALLAALAPLAHADESAPPKLRQTVSPAPDALRETLRRARPFAGADGKIRIHASGSLLINPADGSRLTASAYLRQVLGTPDGAVVVANDTHWGALLPAPESPGRAEFRPVAALPLEECRMAVSSDGELLFFGRNTAGGHALLLFAPDADKGTDYTPLMRSDAPIAAAAADKTHAYAATGDTIHRVPLADRKAAPEAWLRAPAPVTDLLADGRGGLFVATASHVLHASGSGETRTLVASRNARLTMAGGALHILREDLSVLSLKLPATPGDAPAAR